MKPGFFPFSWRRLLAFVGLALLLALILDFNSRLESLSHLRNEAATVRVQATGVMVTRAALETHLAYATSDQAASQWAREQNGMAQPGDIVVAPLPLPGSELQPPPLPLSTPQPLSPWQTWWEFLFGPR